VGGRGGRGLYDPQASAMASGRRGGEGLTGGPGTTWANAPRGRNDLGRLRGEGMTGGGWALGERAADGRARPIEEGAPDGPQDEDWATRSWRGGCRWAVGWGLVDRGRKRKVFPFSISFSFSCLFLF
jgi:hypothetical protein